MGKEVNGTSNRTGQNRVPLDDRRGRVFVVCFCCTSYTLPFPSIVLLAGSISISMCFIVELSFSNCRKSKGTGYRIMVCTDDRTRGMNEV